MSFFLGTQERVRNSRGKRAISVRATEVQLYILSLVYNGSQMNSRPPITSSMDYPEEIRIPDVFEMLCIQYYSKFQSMQRQASAKWDPNDKTSNKYTESKPMIRLCLFVLFLFRLVSLVILAYPRLFHIQLFPSLPGSPIKIHTSTPCKLIDRTYTGNQ